jgi:hypothetical protein
MDCARRIVLLVFAGLCLGPGVAVAQVPTTPPVPVLSAALESCTSSALPASRVAAFIGSMPAITGAERMQMRFVLQRKRPGGRFWHEVRGVVGFGVWESAQPGRAGFVFHKRVDGLPVPATYRAVVRFRWNDADGAIVRSERRATKPCAQPDVRPDLTAGTLQAVLDARPAFALYTLVVRNDGRTTAGPFSVRVAGASTDVPGIAAGGQASVVVLAPICIPGTAVVAKLDADHRVDEIDEHNTLRLRCPLGG